MKRRLFKPSFLVLALILAIALALLSVWIERLGPELVVAGNLCGPSGNDFCYKPALKGGFPFAYLYDKTGISVEGRLSFFEDKFFVSGLMLDIAVYFAVTALVLRALWKTRQ
ncbi:hypothetical protein LQ564_04675 [Massilia sp. G4R7]|uniref:DUF4321 domain-containing protein n=1 Tax=Massilia phyllostachyos TaxID=2898585 RepID=A0ABS8Q3G3_9BURK|nr:hypothetical protein [Massilia phyllostachyos]MCD2515602.1 hypothetical protein [Massilia phyllostachyos]